MSTAANELGNIEIEYKISELDFIEAQIAHIRSKGFLSKRGVQVISVIVIVFGIAGIALTQSATYALGIVWGAFLLFWRPFALRRAYRRDQRWRDTFRARISDKGVHVAGSAGQGEVLWRGVMRYVETTNLFVLYHAPQLFEMFPKRAFKGDALERFRALLHANVAAPARPPWWTNLRLVVFWVVVVISFTLLLVIVLRRG